MQSIIKFSNIKLKAGLKFLPLFVLGFIIYDLVSQGKIGMSYDFIKDNNWDLIRLLWLIPVMILMFANWSFEAIKWRILINSFYKISFRNAFKSIWAGVSTAMSTPNRFGDFIGKISHLPKEQRKRGLVSSFYSSYSQWLITMGMGWVGWLFYGDQIIENDRIRFGLLIIGALIILVSGLLFISKRLVNVVPIKWRIYFFDAPDFNSKIKIVLLSFLRYLTFATQFYLLIRFFGVELGYITVFSKITLFYLITSLVPMTFWGEIGVKESVAVWVFSGLIYNSLIILSVTLLLWLINLIIPAFAGNYFLFKTVSQEKG
jgi:hypothetical protein